MDELKQYLQQHREQLDLDEPGEALWDRIEQATAPVVAKPRVLTMSIRWAAAACILVLAGIGAHRLLTDTQNLPAPALTAANKTNATPEQPLTTEPAPVVVAPATDAVARHNTKPIKQNKSGQHAIRSEIQQQNMALLQNIENSFHQVINLQRVRVSTTPMYAESADYFKDFTIQIKQLEQDEKVIKSDIAKRGMNDELLSQLINLYQHKLNTLKQLQIEMTKLNNRYKQSRGPVDTTRTYFLNI